MSKVGSGIHSAIHSKIRPGNVRRFRTSDECHHRGDLVNLAITVECCGGLLRRRPIARGGVQFLVDPAPPHPVYPCPPPPPFSRHSLPCTPYALPSLPP